MIDNNSTKDIRESSDSQESVECREDESDVCYMESERGVGEDCCCCCCC